MSAQDLTRGWTRKRLQKLTSKAKITATIAIIEVVSETKSRGAGTE
jgi:hypothetical protein